MNLLLRGKCYWQTTYELANQGSRKSLLISYPGTSRSCHSPGKRINHFRGLKYEDWLSDYILAFDILNSVHIPFHASNKQMGNWKRLVKSIAQKLVAKQLYVCQMQLFNYNKRSLSNFVYLRPIPFSKFFCSNFVLNLELTIFHLNSLSSH